jgi:type IV secretory pathway TrbD component
MLKAKPIPRALSRPNLLMGGERDLVLASAVICCGIAATSMNFVAFIVCGLLWLISHTMFVWMAKADPQMSRIYKRHVNYRDFYPAFSTPYRKT